MNRISVLIPAYNAAPYIAEALRSVIDQTRPPDEIIVVDDGSTDDTATIARTFAPHVRVVRQVNQGIAATRNRAVALASGDVIAFLDADDRWTPRKLALQLDALVAQPAPSLIFGHVRQFISPELPPEQQQRIACPVQPQPGYLPGAMTATRQTFASIGAFGAWRSGEFIDWYARARDLNIHTVMLDEIVLERRLHPASHTARQRQTLHDYAHILKAALDRKRS